MNLRVLMIGDNKEYLATDALLLRERNLRVYTCDDATIASELVDEVKPDVIFINWQNPDKTSTDLYHNILDNIRFASVPVIYTLSEDDVYLVNRKRTAARNRRNLISDNVLDAVRMALVNPSVPGRKRVKLDNGNFDILPFAHRA